MMVPCGDIKKKYGFNETTLCTDKRDIEKEISCRPSDIINGIIYVLDKSCEQLGVKPGSMRCAYGDVVLTPIDDEGGVLGTGVPYHFRGKTYKRIRTDLFDLSEDIDIFDRKLAIDFGISHKRGWSRGADLTVFKKVKDLQGALTDDLLKDWSENAKEEHIDNLNYYADMHAGGLLLSNIDLRIDSLDSEKDNPGNDKANNITVSAGISRTLFYKIATDDTIRKRAEFLEENVMKGSPVRIESGYIPGIILERTLVHGRVVKVSGDELGYGVNTFILWQDGGIKHIPYFGKSDVIGMEDLSDVYRAAFADMRISDVFPQMEANYLLLTDNANKAREWKPVLVSRRKTLDNLEREFGWIKGRMEVLK